MAWKKVITEDDFGGFADSSATIAGAAVNGSAATALRSDAALGPLTRELDFGAFRGTNAADPTAAQLWRRMPRSTPWPRGSPPRMRCGSAPAPK